MSNLDGVNFYGDDSLSEQVKDNIIAFIKHGLLEIGAFINLESDASELYPVSGSGITNNTIYSGVKNDWIYEQDISLKYGGGSLPNIPTGILANGVFLPTGTSYLGTGFQLDFSQGRVVFDNPLPDGTSISVPRAARYVEVSDSNHFQKKEITYDWLNQSSGYITDFREKLYLPAIVIGVRNLDTIKGLQLGSRAKVCELGIEFNIFANTVSDRDKLLNLCYMLETKTIPICTGLQPLNYLGEFTNPSGTWGIAKNNTNYYGRFMENAQAIKIDNNLNSMYRARVTIGLELDFYPK